MMNWKWQSMVAGCAVGCAVLVALLFVVAEVEARRGGGGGGRGGGGKSFSRSGPASGGSVRSRQAPSGQRGGNRSNLSDNRGSMQENRGSRQDNRSEQRGNVSDNRNDRLDDRQDHRDNVREDRQDFADDVRDDRRDWYNDRYRYRVGVSITYATFSSLSCTTSSVNVNGVTYYRCDNDWYSRAYSGGNVTYVVVKAPAGY